MLIASHLNCKIGSKTLISGINIPFKTGTLWGVIGPNGAGKSTLLRALAGLIKPAAGDVLWEGSLLHDKPRQEISKIITYVPQQPPMHFDFKVKEIVAMGRYSYSRNYHKEFDAVLEALEAVDMRRHVDSLINELSSGEKQRVYIARALVSCAPVILLDEPSASLDIRHQLEIWDLLRKLVDQQRTVIVTHHDIAAAVNNCGHLVIMHQGQCISQGETSRIITPEIIEHVFGVVPAAEGEYRGSIPKVGMLALRKPAINS